jgi:hypothetical protein
VAGGASSEEVSSEEGKAENDHDENTAMTTVSRQSTREIWKQNYCCADIAPAQLTEHYKALAIQHFGGGGSLKWIHKDRPHLRKTTGIRVTKKRCTFFHVSKCPFVIRELLHTRRNVASIEIGDIPHTSHKLNRVNPVRPGVPKFLQSVVVTSPARVMMHPSKVVASAREKGFKVDTRLAASIRNKVHRIRNPRKINVTPAGSWGGLSASFDTYRRERIASFTEHSVYLLGILCNPEEETLVAVLSSENLLLNAH